MRAASPLRLPLVVTGRVRWQSAGWRWRSSGWSVRASRRPSAVLASTAAVSEVGLSLRPGRSAPPAPWIHPSPHCCSTPEEEEPSRFRFLCSLMVSWWNSGALLAVIGQCQRRCGLSRRNSWEQLLHLTHYFYQSTVKCIYTDIHWYKRAKKYLATTDSASCPT